MRARRGRTGAGIPEAVLGAACALLWCCAGLALAFVPGLRSGAVGAAWLAGWSLGLIPLHAVPARPRPARGPRTRPEAVVTAQPPADGGTGPRWQRGHQ